MSDEFSKESIKILIKQQQDMDNGIVPFVLLNGQRFAVSLEDMEDLGLKQGQTIDTVISMEILKMRMKKYQKEIDKLKIANLKPSDFKL